MLRAETKEDRIRFSPEKRKQILSTNHKICAHCGKKLTLKNMTIEHIIPLSRGGKNEKENLCCLCEDCNKEKRNTFYLPNGFYHAIKKTSRYTQICEYVEKWYQALPENQKVDLRRFPMITPRVTHSLELAGERSFKGHQKKQMTARVLMLEWNLVGKAMEKEVEEETGWKLSDLRTRICSTETDRTHMDEAGIYVLKKVSNEKLLMLVAIRYFEDQNSFLVYIPWANTSKQAISSAVRGLLDVLLYSFCYVAGKQIDRYIIESPIESAFTWIRTEGKMDKITGELPSWGTGYKFGRVLDLQGNLEAYHMEIERDYSVLYKD